MDQRLMKLLQTAVFKDESCMLDTYNQSVQYDCSCTIRTNINTANHHFIMEKLIEPYNTDVDGNCFCLKANYYKMGGANFIGHTKDGFKATCVMEVIERDTPMKGNYKEPRICTMVGRDPNNPSSRVRSEHYEQFIEMGTDVSNTLTSVQKDNLVSEPLCIHQATKQGYIEFKGREIKDGDGLYLDTSDEFFRGGLSGLSRTLKSEKHDAGVVTNYRIRKLTPRECFRLMGVSETNIEKIQKSGVSQSQQYKMAGNSIVVDVLEHIFRKLFVNTGQESQQLSLF